MSKISYALAYVVSALSSERRGNTQKDKGATAVEYALVIGLVSIVIVGAVALFGPSITTFVNGVTFR